jgi:hypothetical protein
MAGGREIVPRHEGPGGGDRFGMNAAIVSGHLVGRHRRVIDLGLRDARTNGLSGLQDGAPPHEAAFVGVTLVGRSSAD